MPESNADTHWHRTCRLMAVALGLWFMFAIVLPMFVPSLNRVTIPFVDLPLGFFLAAQGALLIFVVIVFRFARRQDRVDRDHFLIGDDM